MQTKLTLRLDDQLIQTAKDYAALRGLSVSQLVANYFALMAPTTAASQAANTVTPLSPRVQSLLGALSGIEGAEEEYLRHLEDKHQ